MKLADRLRNLRDLLFRDARMSAEVLCLHLRAGQTLRLRDAQGWRLECRGGSAWITQEGDARDTVVAAGERFDLDRDGLALIFAVEDAILAVHAPARARGRRAAAPAAHGPGATESLGWLGALYPQRPWTPPSAYRRMGLI